MRSLIKIILKFLAKRILQKYRPQVVGITGSIGKSSAKEAVYQVLASQFRVRVTAKNYNNELGVPLTIIGRESAGRSAQQWLKIFFYALGLILKRQADYPEILILELGVDRPGDMAYLCSIVRPEVGLVTAVSYAHLEFFGTVNNIKKEKQILIEQVPNKGLSVLNYDNELTREMAALSRARVLTYGLDEKVDLRAQDIVYNFEKGDYDLSGIHFKLSYDGAIVPVFMKNVLSEPALYAALAGAAVGLYFKLNLVNIAAALSNFNLPPGRMNLLAGLNHSFILDDTYNASPDAAVAALNILSRLKVAPTSKKYAVLGDMREIGDFTEAGHRLVGKVAAQSGIDSLLVIGACSKFIKAGALEAGFPDEKVQLLSTLDEAVAFIRPLISHGDVVLVKGSQAMRLERVVKEIMAEPEQADSLLVRQGPSWQN
ncbi:UDP-N-acetylmuramoyl-tripeptide--D-alanyl-D-alanine ligase [Candidatus Falkowbacteria bacterium]|jgi:UDP-N-acetylmuramoyl-tripeptide--D-alanyl-D-alanine ligase|nr:UDP-N-acetylmuramoyl-tripeptide--D-alanyl-D-alanine ligase [Patescibacteria group bacterium]MDD3435161.1 UDP-N-acetylmuramoyl-tripeptide--D-alanyl-D-alanine ligase [Patescibacteria group bacterium]MDD4466302.1 UDP-N-acetylmuramoyl-tripeptide--D-alanyl-D-alanine ligase [Patescibacteria group bacterium]NCU42780.1 UDP-N-acetylmuramoyl-tripeptide--D-alanyl-D-alanine ligase [Candidatus Falkowbacteria bacterium]